MNAGGTPLQLEIRLSINYPGKARVLDDAKLEIERGEIVGLVGESGSGKSSLALALMRLLHLRGGTTSGEIKLGGTDLMKLSEKQMRRVRGKEMAFVPQSPTSFLNPALNIWDQMAEAWRAHAADYRSRMEQEICRAIELVGLPAERQFLRRKPGEVSVGQAQRVLIAMAILHRPKVLIADEPTSSLDLISQAGVLRLLSKLNREMGTSFLFISHDLLSVSSFCHRVAILQAGRIVEFEKTDTLFQHPSHPYTKTLVDAIPVPPLRRNPYQEIPFSLPTSEDLICV